METRIKPDKKYYTKNIYVILTIILFIIITIALTNLFLTIAGAPPPTNQIMWWIGHGCIGVMILIVYPISHLWIKNLSYTILDDRVTIHKGILTKTKQNIPFRAITDFILQRSLYDRFLGIGSIKVQTAGQSQNATSYEGNLDGLLDYDSLHAQLREKIKAFHPTNKEDIAVKSVSKDEDVLDEILNELKQIRRNLDK